MRERRYDIDWLRVSAMLVVFFYHSGRFFNERWWFVKNAEISPTATVLTTFADVWMMPLFFILSGFGTGFSLRFRSASEYALERFKRLFIPCLFGSLLIVPPQVYFERVFKGQLHGSYLRWYPHFFEGVYPKGNFSWHHLWFLIYLFVFSMLALPLFLRLKTEPGQGLVSRLASLCQKPGGVFLLAIPIIPIEIALRPIFPGLQTLVTDWANFLTYITLFIYGYLFASEAGFGRAVEKHWKAALVLALCCTGAMAFAIIRYDPQRGYTLAYALTSALKVFTCWFWLVTILGLGQRFLNFSNRGLQYANQAVLPFYVMHQTVIITIGFYVVQSHTGIPQKYLMISTASFVAIMAAYELVIRRFNVTRFLFGMRLKPRAG
jgi:hypothetical protein